MYRRFITPLTLAILVAVICGGLRLVEPLDHVYWNTRFKLSEGRAPASVVIVTMRGEDAAAPGSAEEGEASPAPGWPSVRKAELLHRVRAQLPAQVLLDTPLLTGDDAAGDLALEQAIAAFDGNATLVARARAVDAFGEEAITLPASALRKVAPVAVSAWHANFLGYGVASPYAVELGGSTYPAVATILTGVPPLRNAKIYPDFTIAPDSVPRLRAIELLEGAAEGGLLTGKTVFITDLDSENAQRVGFFGRGRVPSVMLDIAAAEALRRGHPFSVGWLPLVLVFAVLAVLGSRLRDRPAKTLAYALAAATTTAAPVVLQGFGIASLPGPAIAAMVVFASTRSWRKWRERLRHTSDSSGLPNLAALVERGVKPDEDVVVAVIARYEEMLATLPPDLHGEFARQVARRLALASSRDAIHHGDNGHFAWSEEARPFDVQFNHLEGMRALFSAPLTLGEHTFDINLHFGLDRNGALDAQTRVSSALASANEALSHGRLLEHFEASRLAEAPWELSLHARIDEGLRSGEIWLAYQPQLDLRDGRISGAEALIRWNHPTRGPITPDAFILQAERAGRIDTLTYWVIEQAIAATRELNAAGERFQMSVNLSAQMVDKPELVPTIEEIVARHAIDCRLLTMEITETSGVRNRPAARENLARLRALGFRVSIDDFGTGEASLSYLAEMPVDELKLDRRFVGAITTCARNRSIVLATIGLAHALGQEVVAEGIEDEATLRALQSMGCDMAQGYHIARPQPFPQLCALIGESRRVRSG